MQNRTDFFTDRIKVLCRSRRKEADLHKQLSLEKMFITCHVVSYFSQVNQKEKIYRRLFPFSPFVSSSRLSVYFHSSQHKIDDVTGDLAMTIKRAISS